MSGYAIRDIKIANLVDKAEKDIQGLKSQQYVGSRVLQTKVSTAGELYQSRNEPFPDDPDSIAFKFIFKNVTFKADKQKSPYGRLLIEILKSDGVTPVTPSDMITGYTLVNIVTNIDDGLLKWQVDIRGPAAQDFYVRFLVAATDTGTITAEEAELFE